MAFTFTDVFELPARAYSGVSGLLLGSFQKETTDLSKSQGNPGLLGWVTKGINAILSISLTVVAYIGCSITDFLETHHLSINIGFWSALTTASVAALCVALSPAALTAVTAFSVAGISIASVVGTGFAAQVGAVALLAAITTNAAVHAVATVVNTVSAFARFLSGCCCSEKEPEELSLRLDNGLSLLGSGKKSVNTDDIGIDINPKASTLFSKASPKASNQDLSQLPDFTTIPMQ